MPQAAGSVTISPPLRSQGPSPLFFQPHPKPFLLLEPHIDAPRMTPDEPVPLQPPVKYGTNNCSPLCDKSPYVLLVKA